MALLHRLRAYYGVVTAVNPTFFSAYTVPSGYRYVIKAVTVRNLDGTSSRTVYLRINNVLIWSAILAAGGASGSFVEWDTDVVVHEGDVIDVAISGGTAGTAFTISGSIYSV